jgi:hypothetical protein
MDKTYLNVVFFIVILALGGCSKINVDYPNKGSHVDPILTAEKEFCPRFEDCTFQGENILLDTCDVDLEEWKLSSARKPFETGKIEKTGLFTVPEVEVHDYQLCKKGLLAGQNINHLYCKIDIVKGPIVDSDGNILSSGIRKTINATYDIHTKKLIKQNCINKEVTGYLYVK